MGLLNDIAALAKAGYTVAEVRELMTLAQDQTLEKKSPDPAKDPEAEKEPEPEKQNPEMEKQSLKESQEPSGDQSGEIENLKKQLAAAQDANRKKDISGSVKTDQDTLNDLVKAFM